jgi:hypothetical protein
LIVLTNGRTLLDSMGVVGHPQAAAYAALVGVWCLAILVVVRGVRLERSQGAVAAA